VFVKVTMIVVGHSSLAVTWISLQLRLSQTAIVIYGLDVGCASLLQCLG